MVEGHGEVEALPVLVRRAATAHGAHVVLPRPVRVPRSKLTRTGELERAAVLVRRLYTPAARMLVVLDADDDCPARFAPELHGRLRRAADDAGAAVVLPTRELEAWFLAGVESLRGRRGVRDDAEAPADVESFRDAKGRLARMMARPYSEVTDPPAFAALLDFDLARRRSPSFDKFLRDVERLLRAEP